MLSNFAEPPPPATERKRTRVALVRGPIFSSKKSVNNEATPALGIAYVTAYLRQAGYETTMVDAIGDGLNRYWPVAAFPGYMCQGLGFDELVAKIPADVQAIGFSFMFSGEWPMSRLLVRKVRERFPDAVLFAGGEHVTAVPEFSLRDSPELDVCVMGEGEHTCYELIERVEKGQSYEDLRGVCYRGSNGEPVLTPPMPRIRDVDKIPWPHWPDGYMEKFWQEEKSYGICTARDMPMNVSRGCPYECTFCSNPVMWTRYYWLRSPDDVIREIRHYIQRYDITSIQLYDLTAITKRSWTIEFCNKLLEAKIHLTWSLPSGTRSEALDHETLKLLKQTGCSYLVYAPESGSPNTLKRIKKQIKLERFTASVMEAKRQGLTLRTNLIIGFPHETRRDVFQTIWYGITLAARGVDEVSINVFSPYPGSAIFKELEAEGRIVLNDQYFLGLTSLNSDYTEMRPLMFNPFMSARELALYRIGFMLLNYAIGYLCYPSRIWRTLKSVFTHSSAATVFEHRLKDLFRRTIGQPPKVALVNNPRQ